MARHLLFAVLLILSVIPAMSHAASSRYSWLVDQLYTFNHPFKAQLPSELAAKMEKMAVNPFAFYRGTAHLFYQDMNIWPTSAYVNTATRQTWLEGDMHLQNMGAFRDANGNEVFDTNDFDEGYWGPYVWDVRRMTVSILLAAKENGLSSSDQQKAARRFLESYLAKLADFKGNDDEKNVLLKDQGGNCGGGGVGEAPKCSAAGTRVVSVAAKPRLNKDDFLEFMNEKQSDAYPGNNIETHRHLPS